jgi:hypothetical protein
MRVDAQGGLVHSCHPLRSPSTGFAKGAAMSDDNSLVPHVTLQGETLVRMMKPLAYRSAN